MINGAELRRAVLSGADHIIRNKALVDRLNIFPVPGGDTGTNTSMTIPTTARELEKSDGAPGIGAVAHAVVSAMLRGACGDSGVILLLLFHGFSKRLEGLERVTGADLRKALGLDVNTTYKAVVKPTGETILTVSRVIFEKGQAAVELDDNAVDVWSAICKNINETLGTTPELLPVLKGAGVVDTRGKRLCLIFEGTLSILQDGMILDSEQNASSTSTGAADVRSATEESHRNMAAEFDQEIMFAYCTGFIVGRDPEIETGPQTDLHLFPEGISDCVVVVDDEEVIKAHVHTENPSNVLQKALEYGQLLTVKIENMKEQHRIAAGNNQAAPAPVAERPAAPETAGPEEEIGFVTVAAGDDLRSLLMDLGCSQVMSGDQTMNPSTQDIMAVVLATPAKTVMVLPDNRNTVMAVGRTIPLVKDRKVVVLPTRITPQRLSAMLAYDPEVSVGCSTITMMEAADSVATGQATFTAHNSEFGGRRIKEDDILGLKNGKLNMIKKDPMHTVVKLTRSAINCTTSFVTLIYDRDITENQTQNAYNRIKSKISGDVEVTLVDDGQLVYYFIASVE